MKIIKYKFLSCEINHGTEEEPNMEQVFLDKKIQCSDETFEANYAIAQREAYGEITVEDVADPEREPTTEERIAALEEQVQQADETAIELYEMQMAQEEINAAQDDALVEIYEMIGG